MQARNKHDNMEIEDLYTNSDRLIANVSMDFKRAIYEKINWSNRMVCIRGARGVGKTTLLKQYLKSHYLGNHAGLYVSLDDFWFTSNRLIDVADYHYLHGGKLLCVDEVHHYPFSTWSIELKNIYDRYPDMQVYFTGSSMLQMDNSLADLSRRCVFYNLQGLSFREYLRLNGVATIEAIDLPTLLTNHLQIALQVTQGLRILPHFADYLHRGYYPFYKEVTDSYFTVLQQVAANIIEVDVPSVEKVEYVTLKKMKRLLALIAQLVPFAVNMNELSKSLETSRQSVLKMLSMLRQAALVNLLYKGKNTLGQLNKPEKVYLENTNLMYALSPRADIGNIRETFFANQLMRSHEVAFGEQGDFLIDSKYVFEVGGKNKKFDQIKGVDNSYLAVDDIETGVGNKIPLWMFGLLE